MYKDLVLNGCYSIKPNQTKSYIFNIYIERGFGIKKPLMVDKI